MKKVFNKGTSTMNHYLKIAFVSLLTVFMVSTAAYAQDAAHQKITISFNQQTLSGALDQIAAQTGIRFYYEGKELGEVAQKITTSFSNKPLSDVLNHLLKATGFDWQEVNGKIVIKKGAAPVRNTETVPVKPKAVTDKGPGRISGTIIDEQSSETVIGATVKIGNQTATTNVDGTFLISLSPGTYTARITHVGYGTKEISDVIVKNEETFTLNATLKRQKGQLTAVVVTASARKETVNSLLVRQKNAVEVSNGISAEQISRTPDKNIGESLKRISGVNSIDNKFVLVRGIGERYNGVMLDGIALPSTEAQQRNFSFDLIPSNLVDNVVVSKTVTPDMNVSFGGGLIQINTKDIPSENFTSFTAGLSYNDQSTGKDFISRKRGSQDYLGFDDGSRSFPAGLHHTDVSREPYRSMPKAEYTSIVESQSKLFKNDKYSLYKYKAAPSQNYQFTIGRLLYANAAKETKLGLTGSISYRNTQTINNIEAQKRFGYYTGYDNPGAAYTFNTTWGGLLNIGLQLGKTKISLRNLYTHMFDNTLVQLYSYDEANGESVLKTGSPPNIKSEADDPTFIDLVQNKLEGQHALGKVKLEWNLARTSIDRKEKDLIITGSRPLLVGGEYKYFPIYSYSTEGRITPTSRHYYDNKETIYSWAASGSLPFKTGNIRNTVKAGYYGNERKAGFNWQIAAPVRANTSTYDPKLDYLPFNEALRPENISFDNGFSYAVQTYWLDEYQGKSQTHALYGMIDTRLLEKVRLVFGLRAEYYEYKELKNGSNAIINVYGTKADEKWQFLPSANLTYSPTNSINIRAAYSSSVVRPEMMDNSQFWRYSPFLGAQYGNQGLFSTRINSVDLKAEWFPGAGEIISAGAFYKKFDNPAELTVNPLAGNITYYLKSADWATVYGLELEARKNLGFIADWPVLSNFILFGNLTLQQSNVKGTFLEKNPVSDPANPFISVTNKQKRPMYGQSPYLLNGGLQYSGTRLGVNVIYFKSGYKTYIVSDDPQIMEFERPREQLDFQISYRFLKTRKLELKINGGNILNAASVFYRNTASYEVNPDHKGDSGDISDSKRLVPGFSNKYEHGDQITFRQKFGRTFGVSVTYNL